MLLLSQFSQSTSAHSSAYLLIAQTVQTELRFMHVFYVVSRVHIVCRRVV